jgi:hypothetical protein
MDTVDRGGSTPTILGVVGGAALAIGSFLNWATVSVNFDKIAAAVGVDPSQIPPEIRAQGTVSVTGWKGGDGKWTLVSGIVVVAAAALLAMATSRRVLGILMIVGGVVGGGLALYDATIQKNDAIDNAASTFSGLGLPGSLRDYVSLTLGIGIWLCVAGGAVAIVAGIMVMAGRRASVPMRTAAPTGFSAPPPPADAGFAAAPSVQPPVPPAAGPPEGSGTDASGEPHGRSGTS